MAQKVLHCGAVLYLIGLYLLVVPSCGYHFRPAAEPGGTNIQSLAIPLIESTASSRALEGDFTRIVRKEFISHSKIPLVSVEKAKTVLKGRIYQIRTEPLSYTLEKTVVQGQVTTYEVTNARRLKITMEARLIERDTGKIIWMEDAMEEIATFEVGSDPLVNRDNQREALQEIAARLAKRIYLKTIERF